MAFTAIGYSKPLLRLTIKKQNQRLKFMVVLRLPVNTIGPSDLHLCRKIYLPRTVANAKVFCAEEKKYGKRGI